jgi:hypothetical protein
MRFALAPPCADTRPTIDPQARRICWPIARRLGVDVDDEDGPDAAEVLGENLLEGIGFVDEVVDTDSRTVIADRLVEALEADTVANPDDAQRRSGWPTRPGHRPGRGAHGHRRGAAMRNQQRPRSSAARASPAGATDPQHRPATPPEPGREVRCEG